MQFTDWKCTAERRREVKQIRNKNVCIRKESARERIFYDDSKYVFILAHGQTSHTNMRCVFLHGRLHLFSIRYVSFPIHLLFIDVLFDQYRGYVQYSYIIMLERERVREDARARKMYRRRTLYLYIYRLVFSNLPTEIPMKRECEAVCDSAQATSK